MSLMAAAALSGGASLAGSVIGAVSAKKQQERNIKFQRETNAKNEALMREGWARDDTAVQRRAADLEAAGQSPLLAAGSAANPSTPISTVAPRQDKPLIQPDMIYQAIQAGLGALSTIGNLRHQQAQIENLDARTNAQHIATYQEHGGNDFVISSKKNPKNIYWDSKQARNYDSTYNQKRELMKQDEILKHKQRELWTAQTGQSGSMSAYLQKATSIMEKQMWINGISRVLSGVADAFGAIGKFANPTRVYRNTTINNNQ